MQPGCYKLAFIYPHIVCDNSEASGSEDMGYKYNDSVTELFAKSLCCISMAIKLWVRKERF